MHYFMRNNNNNNIFIAHMHKSLRYISQIIKSINENIVYAKRKASAKLLPRCLFVQKQKQDHRMQDG